MKRILIALILWSLSANCFGASQETITARFIATAAPGATPALVSVESNSSTIGNSTGTTVNRCPTSAYCAQKVPALAGNTWVFAVQYTDAVTTLTPTDYTCGTSSCTAAGDTCAITATTSAQNSKRLAVGYCKNLTAGVNELRIGFSTNTSGVAVSILEFNNIDNTTPVDTSVTNTSSGSTTVTAGSFTPGAANKFLVHFGVRTQTPVSASCGVGVANCFTVGSQSNITWVSHSTDTIDGIFEQDGVYSSGSAINPTMSQAASSGFASAAISFNTATAGNARGSGMQIAQIMHQNQNSGSAPASVIHSQINALGNLRVISAGFGGDNYKISGVTSSDSCTWAQAPKGILGAAGTGKTDLWYCANASPASALLIDVTVTGTPIADYTYHVYDILGAATSPLAEDSAFNISLPATAVLTMFESLGPGATDGISIANGQVNSNTCQFATTPSGAVLNATLFGGEDESGGATNPPDENNCWGYFKYSSGTTQQNWTQGFATATAIGGAAYRVTSFMSATATQGTTAARVINSCTHANANLNANTSEWAIQSGTAQFKYVSNTCQPNSQSSDAGTLYIAASFANDQWAQATISALTGGSASGGQGIGFYLRGSTSVNTGYRIVFNNATSNQIEIGKVVSGTFTSLKICSANTRPAASDVIYAQISGSAISLKQNGSAITACNVSDSSIASGIPGFGFSSSMTSSSLTNFSAGNL